MVYAAEENGQDPDFATQVIDLDVENKVPGGDGANALPNFCVFCAAVWIRDECPHAGKGAVNPSRRPLDSALQVLSEFLAGLNETFLDEVKVACDIRRTADPVTLQPHPAQWHLLQ